MESNTVAPAESRRVTLNSCTVDITTTPSLVEVNVTGELDMDDADRVEQILGEAAHSGRPIVRVRLSGLTFADSSAIRAIILGAKAAKELGVVYELINPHGFVQRLLDLTGLTQALSVIHEPAYQEGPNSL